MALIQMSHTWADGSQLTVTLSGKARHPQALGDFRAEGLRLWAGALDEVMGDDADDAEAGIAFIPDPTVET